jgi:penicillin-binding protein 1A
MARFARTMVRLVVMVALASALVAGVLAGLGYSTSRLAHDVATAKEQPMPDLSTVAQVPSVIYAADGQVLATLRSSQYRQPVPLSKVAPILVAAVLDTEDHGFYVHGGFDVESIARALLADVSAGSAVQGGSTIAQQLVKNVFLTDQKTLTRKVREAVLADRLEQKYTKDQILDAYLNTIYLGSGAYGVEAAAREYFNRSADQVNVAQAALLAGLVQAPSAYDPISYPVAARVRRSEVLARMVHYKTITQAQATAANETPLPTQVHGGGVVSYTTKGWYVQEVVQEMLDNPALGATRPQRQEALFGGGLRIYTNEVPGLQAVAQQASVAGVPSSLPKVVSAMAVIDPQNGDVEALVGGPNAHGQYDDATEGPGRQPGSGFKLFTLIGALEEGYNVDDSILGAGPCAILFPGNDYYAQHPMENDAPAGVVSLVEATALSINCAYLRLVHEVTLPKLVAVAHSMGISQPLPTDDPSLVLGSRAVYPLEMAAAYATVADGGIYHTPAFVNHIVDQSGDVVYNGETHGRRVFSSLIADEALLALRATVQYGTGTSASLPDADVAGKTGTTQNSDDAWFNGITPTFAASVWMGYQQGELPMYVGWDGGPCPYPPTDPVLEEGGVCSEVYGAQYPAEIWRTVAQYTLQHTPYISWPTPDYDLMPPVKYIISPQLEHDDIIDHDYPPPPPTTTTTPAPTPPVTTAPNTKTNTTAPGGGPHPVNGAP